MPEEQVGVVQPLRTWELARTHGIMRDGSVHIRRRSLLLGVAIVGMLAIFPRSREVRASEALPPASTGSHSHWAYQPVQLPDLPTLSPEGASRVRQPLDAHVIKGLETKGLSLSPAAPRETLIRRAYFDLIGVPPTLEAVEAFVADPAGDPEAMAGLVDRLLADTRFGERWARYWLDVARYADSKGYVFQEERRYAYSYTYRDWVIGAFNTDLPYDKFIMAQLAADQSLGKEDPRHLAAMGFLTLGRRFLNNPHDIIDDRLDVTFRGLQATTLACARCHDHKFDPIPIADYYSLYGVFDSSEEPKDKPLLGEPERTPEYLAFEAELEKKERAVQEYFREKKQSLFTEELLGKYLALCGDGWARDDEGLKALAKERQLYPSVAIRWRSHLRKLGAAHPVAGPFLALADVPADQWADRRDAVLRPLLDAGTLAPPLQAALAASPPASMAEAAGIFARILAPHTKNEPAEAPGEELLRLVLMAPEGLAGLDPMSLGRDFSVPERDKARELRNEVENFKATAENGPPRAMVLVDKSNPVKPVIFKRGSPGNRGEEVPRQFLGVLSGSARTPFSQGSGRLELAQTIASPSNPLTARVYANRVWLWLTGMSLVESPSDFGIRTPPPSNPALLDHLAASLMNHGWSSKKLIREILLSAAWQQTSERPPTDADAPSNPALVDPENSLLWKMNRRRRDFESFRDSLLAVSGRLDPKQGGRPVSLDSPEANRRTIYGFIDRQNLPGLFRSFDFASPDQHAPKRFQTTVPQQALFALNNPFVLVQARNLAGTKGETTESRVRAIFGRVLGRRPDADEVGQAVDFVSAGRAGQTAGAWEYGTGSYDAAAGAVRFEPFAHHQGDRWSHSAQWPEPVRGHAVAQKDGGHPGPDSSSSVIWRWTSPVSGSLMLDGKVVRPAAEGDGIRLCLITGSSQVVAEWEVKPSQTVEIKQDAVAVTEGDHLDFVIDPLGSDNSDTFQLDLQIRDAGGQVLAKSREEFSGPALDPWVAFAQVLLISNEFMFVD